MSSECLCGKVIYLDNETEPSKQGSRESTVFVQGSMKEIVGYTLPQDMGAT
jgi:hypothetical protein